MGLFREDLLDMLDKAWMSLSLVVGCNGETSDICE